MKQPTMAELRQEEQQLINEILAVLQTKPRRTSTALAALRVLFEGTAMQLPPDGRSAAAMVAAELAGSLMNASITHGKSGASTAIH